MVKFNNIIAFLNKAMENNLQISADYCFDNITIWNNKNDYISIYYYQDDTIEINTKKGRITVNIDTLEQAKYKVKLEEIRIYREQCAKEDFNNFFNTEESVPTINDLDSEDD